MAHASTPPSRSLVALITVASLVFQLYLFSSLGSLSPSLSSAIGDEEDGQWRVKLEAIQALAVLGRMWTLLSACIAGIGLYGLWRDSLPLLRLSTLHQFLSACGDITLIALAAFISISTLSATSTTTSLCEALSNSDLSSSFDIFGWSVESCEEQSGSIIVSLLGCVAAVTLARAWCAFKSLAYYSTLAKKAKRKGLSINTRGDRYVGDNGAARGDAVSPGGGASAGGSGKRGGGGGSRIFLLPRPMDGKFATDIPLVSLTPSSPGYVSFPPTPTYQADPTTPGGSQEQQFLVYAPVLMTEEQALQLQAKEVRYSRPRSRSHTAASPISAPLSSTSTIGPLGSLLMEMEDDPLMGKGKLA